MNRFGVIFAALILVASTAASAFAQNPYASQPKVDQSVWRVADLCAQAAAKLFPDFTPQGNAARENYRRACLRAHNLPAPSGQASVSQ